MAASIQSANPELVVVFEAIDESVDLTQVAARIGFEILGEIDDAVLPDEDFPRISERVAGRSVKACLHAVCLNQSAMDEILRLWSRWRRSGQIARNYTPLGELFEHLRDVRAWSPQDRLKAVDWDEYFAGLLPEHPHDVEIELWFRESADDRQRAEDAIRSAIEDDGGVVLSTSLIETIGYHALKCRVLPALIRRISLSEFEDVLILRSPEVMFFRVSGQSHEIGEALAAPLSGPWTKPKAAGLPRVCVLDGLPVANHPRLVDRVIVHDPDDYASDLSATAADRRHGTAMCSVVIWGDLGGSEGPLERPILVRPILQPSSARVGRAEELRASELAPDLMWRVFRELFESSSDVPSLLAEIHIVNLSVGDPSTPFETMVSSWARMLDWLSDRYGVLVLVAAGNHPRLKITNPKASAVAALIGSARQEAINGAISEAAASRRLLSPAESINALTVVALQLDDCQIEERPYAFDPADSLPMVNPTSALGLGHRRGIKPDLVGPGGRTLFQVPMIGQDESVLVPALVSARGPGVQVAVAPNGESFAVGTSPATAAMTRVAARLSDSLDLVFSGQQFSRRQRSLAVKALLLHGTRHPSGLSTSPIPAALHMGNGVLDRDYSSGCQSNEVVVLFFGQIGSAQRHSLELPLPNGLQVRGTKRVTATLAWFSPVNWQHRVYRRASLAFASPTGMTKLDKPLDVDATGAKLGTAQHLVWEVNRAVPGGSGDNLVLTVECKEQAGGLNGQRVDYAVAVSLWTAPELDIDVYSQVREQVGLRVPITPGT